MYTGTETVPHQLPGPRRVCASTTDASIARRQRKARRASAARAAAWMTVAAPVRSASASASAGLTILCTKAATCCSGLGLALALDRTDWKERIDRSEPHTEGAGAWRAAAGAAALPVRVMLCSPRFFTEASATVLSMVVGDIDSVVEFERVGALEVVGTECAEAASTSLSASVSWALSVPTCFCEASRASWERLSSSRSA